MTDLYDGLGSTAGLADAAGGAIAGYGYDAFGAIRSESGGSGNYWLYTGEQSDAESDLYYLRARYYDPEVGRFLTEDPLPFPNLYAYVGNNPVKFTDPAGQCPWCVAAAVAGAVPQIDSTGDFKTMATDRVSPEFFLESP